MKDAAQSRGSGHHDGIPPIEPRSARTDPESFEIPVEAIRSGRFSDAYFVRARRILEAEGSDPAVSMQLFQKNEAVLAGIDEALAVLRRTLTEGYRWSDLDVEALREGDRIAPWEPVLEIRGPYRAWAHLETLLCGILARGTRIATNTRRVVEAAWPKPVLYFPARHDHWSVQESDGWAAHLVGAQAVSTDAQGARWGGKGMGTIPHALIAAMGGDTVRATEAFARAIPEEVRVISLVDFDNDSVGTSLAVARALGDRLWGVRLDTASTMVDRAVFQEMGDFDPRGVNAVLVRRVRDALDEAGFDRVRIVVSGGFDAEKISRFEREGVPVDSYGVGSSLLRGAYDFTADVVRWEDEPVAKVGRRHRPSDRLIPVS